jgi:uncharacterized membrane protein
MGPEGGEARPTPGDEGEARQRDLLARLSELESFLTGNVKKGIEASVVPAWRRLTEEGEALWPVAIAVGGALFMQITLPNDLELPPSWLLPALGALLGIALLVANPRRITPVSARLRVLALALTATLGLANAYSAIRLVDKLLTVGEGDAVHLLRVGGAIWLTNVIVFALLYWEFDRGGPVARMQALDPYPDFLFPQMDNPRLAPPDWEPRFVDYFYFSFTNATAFSPTDVMPLSRWAKLTMLLQSAVSLATVALVVARAVNILK